MRDDLIFTDAELVRHDTRASPSWFGLLWAKLSASIERWAARYAAATIYEQLSRLSDAELKHRGLSRATLAGDLAVPPPIRHGAVE